jgi:hypothetical protein
VPQTPTATDPPPTSSLPPECFDLATVSADSDITLGDTASIEWIPVPTMGLYIVELFDSEGALTFSEQVEGTSFTFPAEVFPAGGVYGWMVTPIFSTGERTCVSISDEIVVFDPAAGNQAAG